MNLFFKKKSGFTLLELMLVMSILVIIALASREVYNGFALGKNIDNISKTIVFDLRGARSNAMNGQEDSNWGVHFVNSTSDYYEIFTSPTVYGAFSSSVRTTVYLGSGISFSLPSEGNNQDIIFAKLSGTSTTANINIISTSNQKTISVNSEGLVN
ncbi:MAG: pilus assembly FimT family protein [Patescibacteria group bacterium]